MEIRNIPGTTLIGNGVNKILRPFGLYLTCVDSLGQLSLSWTRKLLYFGRLMESIKNIEGDIVECGVASGRSLLMLISLLEDTQRNRHVWGFDSWTGLPKPTAEDMNCAKEGLFGQYTKKGVHKMLTRFGLNSQIALEKVSLIEGTFADTLPNANIERIALLHIDADLYWSHRMALECLWHKISKGGIVALDDYHLPNKWPGARQAVDEFVNTLPQGSAVIEKDICTPMHYIRKLRID